MTYELGFVDAALKEWRKLDHEKAIQEKGASPQFVVADLTPPDLRALGAQLTGNSE